MSFTEKFKYDQVDHWTPLTFGIHFTRQIRKHKGISHQPSLRTSIAIPQFLSARYFRLHKLTPQDYIDAAVLNTVPEDQIIAKEIAQQILFPRAERNKKLATEITENKKNEDNETISPLDPLANIMSDLDDLNIDFNNIDALSDLEQLFTTQENQEDIFSLYERLYSSADREDRSLAELMGACGGPAELQAWGANSRATVENYLEEILRSEIGELTPHKIHHAMIAGLTKMLKQAVSEPWELAAVLASDNNTEALQQHLNDILENCSLRTLGKTLRFLELEKQSLADNFHNFQQHILDKTQDLNAFSELLTGYQSWIPPDHALLQQAAKQNIQQALKTANGLKHQFQQDLSPTLFDYWIDQRDNPPTLRELIDTPATCKRWNQLVKPAYKKAVNALRQAISKPIHRSGIDPLLSEAIKLAQDSMKIAPRSGKKISADYSTEILCLVCNKHHFLPILDELLEHHIWPSEIKRIIEAGSQLGVNPNDIYDRLGDLIKQLQDMILSHSYEIERYKLLADQINGLDEKRMKPLVQQAVSDKNMPAMASLLAIDMGIAIRFCQDQNFIINSLTFKGIGGGMNLLKQWFYHRQNLNHELRFKIKEYARSALEALVFNWLSKGSGSSDGGLIPQNRARPFLAGDDLDLLDIENTLEALISQGKNLDNISQDDLYVYDTHKGRAALGVLIDISGSMNGDDLAICAIAVVMLLGKVRSEEIALAVFESDTHVVKRFTDTTDLDEVMNELLDLEARGGTCAEAAFRWVNEEFSEINQAEFKLLFILSDFCFSDDKKQLEKHLVNLQEMGVIVLAASHHHVCSDTLRYLLQNNQGEEIKLTSINKLPAILLETLEQIGETAFNQ